ncbi:leucine-rich repeat domain-containing protein [Lysinibacter sp. HNR]|uniref:leucine-rich repeat domain-containing protein n=1 Tax=Lysinibacter sp. HNR TaxID=3031408 RepID=UPI0024360941|nr:leucine-rich repeat domain-containing protein [Lysinibacter sp. HNR]WGD37297.1 leucine-rich repeat domain-containing protein [Lysinibacter sp. HNR]
MLRALLNRKLGQGDSAQITVDQARTITELSANNGAAIKDISGLEAFTSLTKLSLGNRSVTNLKPLASLTKLTFLELQGNQITDVMPLANLKNLAHLNLSGNQNLGDVALQTVKELKHLHDLYISETGIKDLAQLKICCGSRG